MTEYCSRCGQALPIERRCCGTCRHWWHIGHYRCNGSCRYEWPEQTPTPEWVSRASRSTRRTQGADCPCYEPKDDGKDGGA